MNEPSAYFFGKPLTMNNALFTIIYHKAGAKLIWYQKPDEIIKNAMLLSQSFMASHPSGEHFTGKEIMNLIDFCKYRDYSYLQELNANL
tara:strand:+ start:246 stop:512 length:267 start_codon:yes stop_codon:yes gene_type:complete